MRRYFFHVCGWESTADTEGTELPSVDVALREATRLAADLLHVAADCEGLPRDLGLKVTDVTGAVVCQLTFTINRCDRLA